MSDLYADEEYLSPVEPVLRRVLGRASLPREQRRRHLDRLFERGPREDKPRVIRRFVQSPVRVGLVALLLVTTIVAVGLWPSSSKRSVSVSAAAMRLSAPAVGRGRHITIEGELGYSADGVSSRWTTDIWQRTLSNGDTELSMKARTPAGVAVGQYIQAGTSWMVDNRGDIQYGVGKPMIMPVELTNTLMSPEALQAALQSVVSNGEAEQIKTVRQGDDQVTVFDWTRLMNDSLRDELSQDYGVSLQQALIEIRVNVHTGQLHVWNQSIIDTQGQEHILRQMTITRWDDVAGSAVDPAHFADVRPTQP